MKPGHLNLLLTLVFLLFINYDAHTQTRNDGILFLFLRMEKNSIALDSTKVSSGKIKDHRSKSVKEGWLRYEWVAKDGRKIGESALPDPRLTTTRLEYEDPEVPGTIKTVAVAQDTVRFVLRIPFDEEVAQVSFYQPLSPAGKTQRQEEKIGSISIKMEEFK